MSQLASAIGGLGNLGIESYEIASGAPVSTSSVGGITTVQTGAAVNQTTTVLVLVAVVVLALVLWLLLK